MISGDRKLSIRAYEVTPEEEPILALMRRCTLCRGEIVFANSHSCAGAWAVSRSDNLLQGR